MPELCNPKDKTMSMTENGVSTTQENGEEQYEEFTVMGKTRVQYDYRHTNGKLFSCVAKTLQACREKRNAWIERQLAAVQ